MHIPTHILSGWCLADQVRLTARERLLAMMAATLADLDGVGRVFGEELYWKYHHKVGHNVFYAIAMSAVLAAFSRSRGKAFILYLLLAHVHLVLDYYGSGPLWPIYYFWPVSEMKIANHGGWEFLSWENVVAFVALLVWTIWIAVVKGRTPVEAITPELDRRVVGWLRRLCRMPAGG